MQGRPNSTRFVSKLENICKNYETETKQCQNSWILVLVAGNTADVESSVEYDEKKQSTITDSNQDSIVLIHKDVVNIEKQHSYYLGDCLFGLIINKTMKQCVVSIKKLLADSKKSLSIGMATLGRNINSNNNNNGKDVKELQRYWVAMAYTNLLRAKEAGGNCFFNNEVCTV